MDKYRQALGDIYVNSNCEYIGFYDDINTLIELVEKGTPKKPIYADKYDDTGDCPTCKSHYIYDYEYDRKFKRCSDCGQVIDWHNDGE